MPDVKFSQFDNGTMAVIVGLNSDGENVKQSFVVLDFMLKATYDPRNAGYISGASDTGGNGGTLNFDAGSGNAAPGGSFAATGGTADFTAAGSLNLSGGSSDNAAGGTINASGGTLPGGSIDTHDGGGRINTRDAGYIELGASGTRSTINGHATADRVLDLPDASGTFLLSNPDSGWVANGDAGDKTSVIPDNTTLGSVFAALDIVAPGANTALTTMANKIKALEAALAASSGAIPLFPNA